MAAFNYRHLYYFWVVAKEGGFARAAERLDMALQTISAQVRELEKSLGHQLLKPQGRGVTLTEAGDVAYARAEEIFQIGQRSAKVDVERLPVDDQRGYRHHAVALGLSDPILLLAQMDTFYRVPRRIECLDEVLLGGYTHWATSMEQQGFAHDRPLRINE